MIRTVLATAAHIAVELCRRHRCPIGGCTFTHHRIEVLAAHAKGAHEQGAS